jgi:hypothetical protein
VKLVESIMSQLSLSVKLLGVSILDYDGGVEVYIENDGMVADTALWRIEMCFALRDVVRNPGSNRHSLFLDFPLRCTLCRRSEQPYSCRYMLLLCECVI